MISRNRAARVKALCQQKTHALRLFRGPFLVAAPGLEHPGQESGRYQEMTHTTLPHRSPTVTKQLPKTIAAQQISRYNGPIDTDISRTKPAEATCHD